MKTKNQQCNLYLPIKTVAMLDRMAEITGKPRSTLVNEILTDYLEPALVSIMLNQDKKAEFVAVE